MHIHNSLVLLRYLLFNARRILSILFYSLFTLLMTPYHFIAYVFLNILKLNPHKLFAYYCSIT